MSKWTGSVQLDGSTIEYICDLKKTGLFGRNVDEVVEGLILEGVRRAIDDGHIKVRIFEDALIDN